MPFALLKLAHEEGIKVEYWDFPPPILGIYSHETDFPPFIGLDHSLFSDRRKLRCVLAEEIGHHLTTVGNYLLRVHYHYSDRINISRAEYRALKWAANYLIPEDKLRVALKRGVAESWELADYFNVTEKMIEFRLRLLLIKARCAI